MNDLQSDLESALTEEKPSNLCIGIPDSIGHSGLRDRQDPNRVGFPAGIQKDYYR